VLQTLNVKETYNEDGPHGEYVHTYTASGQLLRQAVTTFIGTICFGCLLIAIAASDDRFRSPVNLPNVVAVTSFVIVAVSTLHEWRCWQRHHSEHYELYQDGLVYNRANVSRIFLSWRNLKSYQVHWKCCKADFCIFAHTSRIVPGAASVTVVPASGVLSTVSVPPMIASIVL